MLPSEILVNSHPINTITFFLGFAFVFSLFTFWRETRRDGFDEERSIDLFVLSSFTSVLYSRFLFGLIKNFGLKELFFHTVTFWVPGYSVAGALLGIVIPVFIFTRHWKWSLYRVFDILSVTLSLGMALVFFGLGGVQATTNLQIRYGIASFLFFGFYILLQRFRLKFRSGMVFSIFLIFAAISTPLFLRELHNLIFYLTLFTISVLNLLFRGRSSYMNTQLPTSFINNIKKKLLKKDKELENEQKRLLEEDPYLKPGRDTVDEYLDDVQEDMEKEVIDMRMSAAKDFQIRVKRALAKIKLGSYGTCDVCKKKISKERLKAYPEATTCVEHSS